MFRNRQAVFLARHIDSVIPARVAAAREESRFPRRLGEALEAGLAQHFGHALGIGDIA
jgi:hypothetical protein